jgi:hypothetical protein
MNMVKLGTVSRSLKIYSLLGNPLKYRAGGLTRYTLCVQLHKIKFIQDVAMTI